MVAISAHHICQRYSISLGWLWAKGELPSWLSGKTEGLKKYSVLLLLSPGTQSLSYSLASHLGRDWHPIIQGTEFQCFFSITISSFSLSLPIDFQMGFQAHT